MNDRKQGKLYEDRTAAIVADFLRGLELRVHASLAHTGVRAEWMAQDGPAKVRSGN